MSRPALIFDFGNVIAHFDFAKAFATLGAELGLGGRELMDRLDAAGLGPLHREFERGQIGAAEFTRRVSALVGLKATHEEFARAWGDIFTANESIVPVIASLKEQGYGLVLGSNTNDLHAAHFRTQFGTTLAYFDRLVLSYEVGEMKPHRDFYLACAAAAGRPPAECLFIDDLEENIVGARAAGLQGIVYRTTPELIRDLAQQGVRAGSD